MSIFIEFKVSDEPNVCIKRDAIIFFKPENKTANCPNTVICIGAKYNSRDVILVNHTYQEVKGLVNKP